MSDPKDFQKMLEEAASAFRMDPETLRAAFMTQAGKGEKLSQAAIGAAEKSTELSAQLTREALARLAELTKARDNPEQYAQAMQAFAQAQAQMMQSQLTGFAEIARSLQADTMEAMREGMPGAEGSGKGKKG